MISRRKYLNSLHIRLGVVVVGKKLTRWQSGSISLCA